MKEYLEPEQVQENIQYLIDQLELIVVTANHQITQLHMCEDDATAVDYDEHGVNSDLEDILDNLKYDLDNSELINHIKHLEDKI